LVVFTGAVRSGKTTELFKYCGVKKDCDGILQPVVNDKRFLFFIRSKQLIQLETTAGSEPSQTIGDFHFSEQVFEQARAYLDRVHLEAGMTIMIDEIGQIELGGKGMEPAVSTLLERAANIDATIVLVVRRKLLEQFNARYKDHLLNARYQSGNLLT
jgi:nucleoside-triphosphatase THEP1